MHLQPMVLLFCPNFFVTAWQIISACGYNYYYGAILPRRRPHHLLILSVCPVPPPRGKMKRPTNTKLGRKGPWTPAPRGPISRPRGQRSRSRWLIALLAKNPHNIAARCPINLIFGRWRKDPLPPCTGWPRCHGNGRSVRLFVRLSVVCLHLERKRNGLGRPNLVGRVPGTRAPRGPISKSEGQRSRSRWLIAQFAKNPHNFTASWPINFIFGRCQGPLATLPRVTSLPWQRPFPPSVRLSVLRGALLRAKTE